MARSPEEILGHIGPGPRRYKKKKKIQKRKRVYDSSATFGVKTSKRVSSSVFPPFFPLTSQDMIDIENLSR